MGVPAPGAIIRGLPRSEALAVRRRSCARVVARRPRRTFRELLLLAFRRGCWTFSGLFALRLGSRGRGTLTRTCRLEAGRSRRLIPQCIADDQRTAQSEGSHRTERGEAKRAQALPAPHNVAVSDRSSRQSPFGCLEIPTEPLSEFHLGRLPHPRFSGSRFFEQRAQLRERTMQV
jgi:hypothetical protein